MFKKVQWFVNCGYVVLLLTLFREVLLHNTFLITIHDRPVAELLAVIVMSRNSIIHLLQTTTTIIVAIVIANILTTHR